MLTEAFSPKYMLKLFNRRGNRESNESVPYTYIEIANADELEGIFDGIDTVIHLAADRRAEAPWHSLLYNNMIATYNVFEACKKSRVKRVIYVSSVHVQQGYIMGDTPETFNLSFYERGKLIDVNDSTFPDSIYAVSKNFGEELGKYYAKKYGIEFVALRMGWTIAGDNPLIMKGTTAEDYMRAIYLSKNDCIEIFTRAVEAPMKPGQVIIAYATSDNGKKIFDLTQTKKDLGYEPKDNAETFFKGQ